MQFNYSMNDPEVERLARAICERRKLNPDNRVPDNGYDDAPMVPLWWKYQDRALDFIAMREAEIRPPITFGT